MSNTRYIARQIRYFFGKPGHEFTLVFLRDTIDVGDPNCSSLLQQDDFVGMVQKAPKTGWGGMVPLPPRYDGQRYVAEAPTKEEAIQAVRAAALELQAEEHREATDPVYALEKALKRHDWYYTYSDDPRVYRAGAHQFDVIQALRQKVDPKVADELFARYAPAK